jgi:hypothetical protein
MLVGASKNWRSSSSITFLSPYLYPYGSYGVHSQYALPYDASPMVSLSYGGPPYIYTAHTPFGFFKTW